MPIALERLAFLRKHLPSHGTHGEEMFNAFNTVEAALHELERLKEGLVELQTSDYRWPADPRT